MYGPTDLKKNTLITLDGQPYKVVEYSQKVMGRGGSIVNVKVKNLITGALLPKTFKGQEKIEPAEVTTRKVQYLYRDDEKFYFMDLVLRNNRTIKMASALRWKRWPSLWEWRTTPPQIIYSATDHLFRRFHRLFA